MRDRHLKNVKQLIDTAIQRGLFLNAESVGNIMETYRYLEYASEIFERVGDIAPGLGPASIIQSGLCPKKSMGDMPT